MKNRIVKQCALTALASMAAMNAFAVAAGLYIGAEAGPTTSNAKDQTAWGTTTPNPDWGIVPSPYTLEPVTLKPKAQQFGSRFLVGYMMNQYVGMEAGLNYFSSTRFTYAGDYNFCSSANARVMNIDVVGKGVVPVRSFNVFGKAGVAFAYQTSGGALNTSETNPCGDSSNTTKAVPTFSLGAGYDLNQNWVADATLTNVMVGGKSGTITMFGLGLSYHFVDVYCGQFLC